MTCPRCGGPLEPDRRDELVVQYHCADPECNPPHPLYQGEHPAKFWALFLLELATKTAKLVYHLLRLLPGYLRRLSRTLPRG